MTESQPNVSAPPDGQTSAPTKPRHKVRLHPVNAVLMLALFLASFWLCGLFSGKVDATGALVGFVTPLMVIFVGLVLGLIAFAICKRSSRIFNVVLGLILAFVVGLMSYGAVGRFSKPQTKPGALDPLAKAQLAAIVDEMKEHNRQRVAAGDGSPDPGYVEVVAKKIEGLASKYPGPSAAILKAEARFQRDIGAANNGVIAAEKAFTDAGGLNVADCKDKHDLEARLSLLNEVIHTNDEMGRMAMVSTDLYERTLREAEMPAREIPAAVRIFVGGGMCKSYAALSGVRGRLYSAISTYLSILIDNWGHWKHKDNKFVFESPAQVEAFNKALEELRGAGKAQQELTSGGTKGDPGPAPGGQPADK